MDGDMVLIFVFIVVITAIMMGVGNEMLRNYLKYRERKEIRAEGGTADGGNPDWRKLEERVRVLERIATDSNHALASQIEQLRDLDALEDRTGQQEIAR